MKLAHGIQKYLEGYSDPIPKGVVWSGYMIGRTKTTARPTTVFCSTDSYSRKQVRNLVLTSGLLENYPGFRTAECSKLPDFDQLIQLSEGDLGCSQDRIIHGATENGNAQVMSIPRDMIQFSRNLITGRSMVEFSPSPGVTKRATICGAISIANIDYLFTVAHIFTGHTRIPELGNIAENSEFDIDDNDEEYEENINEQFISGTSFESFSISSMTSKNVIDMQPDSISPERNLAEELCEDQPSKNVQSCTLLHGTEAKCTVSADLIDKWPTEKVQIFLPQNSVLDYCLIKPPTKKFPIPPPCTWELVHGASREPLQAPEVGSANIFSLSGTINASLSSMPTFITQPGYRKSQELWKVQSTNVESESLKEGDCGAWVIFSRGSELCGHLIAGNISSGNGYIVPAYAVFEDINHRFGEHGWPSRWSGSASLRTPALDATQSLFPLT